jgi:hypothetical protein
VGFGSAAKSPKSIMLACKEACDVIPKTYKPAFSCFGSVRIIRERNTSCRWFHEQISIKMHSPETLIYQGSKANCLIMHETLSQSTFVLYKAIANSIFRLQKYCSIRKRILYIVPWRPLRITSNKRLTIIFSPCLVFWSSIRGNAQGSIPSCRARP